MIRAAEHPEPWGRGQRGPRGREKGVYWFVYLGELDLSAAVSSLLDLFPDDSPEKAGRIKGTTTMAVVVLDEVGRPVDGKAFVSSFAWGYGKVLAGELRTLAEFPQEDRKLCKEIAQRLTRMNAEGEVLPVTYGSLVLVTDWLLRRLRLPGEQVSCEPVYVRFPIWRRAYEAPEPELLNSFFLEDLERVRAAFRSGEVGLALASFVSGQSTLPRNDVARNQAILDEALAPALIPLARWPGRGRFPLVTMQQAAVSHAARELVASGLIGINGPPGTGKTTLLRDVVAKVVLDRASAMAAFGDPQEAFSHVAPMSNRGVRNHLYRLDESLLGHEIVVASSNNRAVENISREIPEVGAVADDFEPPLRYFASVSDAIAREGDRHGEVADGRTWGLAAAVLGKADNRARFVDSFWWHQQRGMQKYLLGIVTGWNPTAAGVPGGEGQEPSPEVLNLEDAPKDRAQALVRWKVVQKRFREALKRAESRRRSLDEIRHSLHRRRDIENSLETSRVQIMSLRTAVDALKEEAASVEQARTHARGRTREALADREAVQALRPGFFARLFTTRRHREWRDAMARRVAAAESARVGERTAERILKEARSERETSEIRLRELEAMERNLVQELAEVRSILMTAKAELGERLPDQAFWSRPEEERQLLSPWLSDRFQAERDELFAACFELHRAFISAAAPRLRHNLSAAMLLLKGRKLSERQEPARRSLWASLFLVVPVISTTFASVSRMFGPLGRERLGWLLIDEAGQAVPQAAVGAMWRSQRVIAIGDPMQVPPVVTMPQRLIAAVLGEYGIDPEAWSAPRVSVQSLADRASWFGTTLQREDGDLWVGAPLRVHRRCDEPMFGVCNRIAYDGNMVQATSSGNSPIGDALGESGWFHVDSNELGHWSALEGELAAALLRRMLEGCSESTGRFFHHAVQVGQVSVAKKTAQSHRRAAGAGSLALGEREC